MKKAVCILILVLIAQSPTLKAQQQNEPRFYISAFGGLGFGIVENDIQPDYNLNSNNGEIHLAYRLSQNFSLVTGLGVNQLSGNGYDVEGNFYHERDVLKIPFLLSYDLPELDNYGISIGLGLYGQSILKDEYQYLDVTQENLYEGWSFGAQMTVSIVYKIKKYFTSVGIIYNGQSDFTKFESYPVFVVSKINVFQSLLPSC
jgi:hypothetical protein